MEAIKNWFHNITHSHWMATKKDLPDLEIEMCFCNFMHIPFIPWRLRTDVIGVNVKIGDRILNSRMSLDELRHFLGLEHSDVMEEFIR